MTPQEAHRLADEVRALDLQVLDAASLLRQILEAGIKETADYARAVLLEAEDIQQLALFAGCLDRAQVAINEAAVSILG